MTTDPAATPMTDIHDLKPLLAIAAGVNGWTIAAVVAAVVVMALLVFVWWRRRKPQKKDAPNVPVLSPEAEAYGQLDRLAAGDLMDLKMAYFQLSAIIRRYVERRFAIPAAEMTTEELLPALDRLALGLDLVQPLKAFCRATDPIKFAGASASRDRLPADLALARDFVRRTTIAAEPSGSQPEPQTAPAGQRRIE